MLRKIVRDPMYCYLVALGAVMIGVGAIYVLPQSVAAAVTLITIPASLTFFVIGAIQQVRRKFRRAVARTEKALDTIDRTRRGEDV